MSFRGLLTGCICCLLFWGGCRPVPTPAISSTIDAPLSARPKNVILMIGDGMGLGQVSAGLYSSSNRLNLEQFPIIGFQKTHSDNNLITDSAAGATAIACGIKTYNSAIGLGPDSLPCYTILEEAEDRGLATGLVVTSQITNATPAAFISHQTLRAMNENIAIDFVESGIDFFIGGGLSYFKERSLDDRNLIDELTAKNYQVYNYRQGNLTRLNIDLSKKFAYFSADNLPPGVNLGRNYLPFGSKIAAQFLSQKSEKGFFLMIEGSQIDWAAHSNDGPWMIKEMLDFDRTIGLILEFAKKRGDTLVIVTADHETGGVAISDKSKMNKLKLDFTTNHHTASMVPVFAFGPQARSFSGIFDNTQIYYKIKQALNWGELPNPRPVNVEGTNRD